MKRVKKALLYVALLVAIGAIVAQTANDPFVKSKLAALPFAQIAQASDVDRFAESFCFKDAEYMAPRLSGALAMPVEDLQMIFDSIGWDCHGIRALGVVHGEEGDEYFYAFNVGAYEIWWGITWVDGKAVDLE